MSDSLLPHEPQHARHPCPSPTPGVHPNLCPLGQWCHPTISSSVVPSSFCPQSFPASGSFLMSQLFASGGQSIGASASASVHPASIQCLFPWRLTGLISLLSKGLSRVFSSITVWKRQCMRTQRKEAIPTCFKNRWEGVVTVSWVKPGGLQWEGGFAWGDNRWSERVWGGGNNWLKQSPLWFCPLGGRWVDLQRSSSRSWLFSWLLVLAGSCFAPLFSVF